jgi:hypothetical protein
LARLLAELGRELSDVDRGRRAVRGYAMQTPRRARLDRTG